MQERERAQKQQVTKIMTTLNKNKQYNVANSYEVNEHAHCVQSPVPCL